MLYSNKLFFILLLRRPMGNYRKIIILSLKIGIGSCAALHLAEYLNLEYAISAGTITLLTLLTTKWETLHLSLWRIVTFLITVLMAAFFYSLIPVPWIAYGLLLALLTGLSEILDLRPTLSVNAVIAAHLLSQRDHLATAVINEFFLVLIGIVFAVLFNLFQMNDRHKKHIISNMSSVENRLQMLMGALAAYLSNKSMERDVWADIVCLEQDLQDCVKEAYEYQNNTFHSHPEYYISYFEMRYNQCQILHNLHYEMQKIRTTPEQAHIIADYMLYLTDFITEHNLPELQLQHLEDILTSFRESSLPQTREEFENRAVLYHIMMDLEDFLLYKKRFVKNLDSRQLEIYWKQ